MKFFRYSACVSGSIPSLPFQSTVYFIRFDGGHLAGSFSSRRVFKNFCASPSTFLAAKSMNLAAKRKRTLMFVISRTYARQWSGTSLAFKIPRSTSLSVTGIKRKWNLDMLDFFKYRNYYINLTGVKSYTWNNRIIFRIKIATFSSHLVIRFVNDLGVCNRKYSKIVI